jgi:hypothetical protein
MTFRKFSIIRQHARPAAASNIIPLGPYRRKAAAQRRLTWWAMLLGLDLGDVAQGKPAPVATSAELVHFRRHAKAARW